jgi:hypothetical protein
MRELMNRRELGQFGINVERGKQHASTFIRGGQGIAQFDDFRLHLGPFRGSAKPLRHEWNHLLRGKAILLGSRLVVRSVGDVDRWPIEAIVVANDKEWHRLPEGPECTLVHAFVGSAHLLKGSQASCLAIADQDCWRAFAGSAQLQPQLCLHFTRLPPRDRFEHAVPSDRFADSLAIGYQATYPMPRTALDGFANLIPIAMPGHFRGHTNSSQPGRIKGDDALYSDFQFHRALGGTSLGKVTRASGKRTGVVDVRGVGLGNELSRFAVKLDRSPVQGGGNLKANIFCGDAESFRKVILPRTASRCCGSIRTSRL